MAPAVPPGSVRPLHTTGARRLAPADEPRMTGMRAVSAMAPRAAGAASCTRKLAWLTMTCAGSHGTLTELRPGSSSKPGERPPVGVRGVLVSTLI